MKKSKPIARFTKLTTTRYSDQTRYDDVEGPWNDEPDVATFFDTDSAYWCHIVRNHMGSWCGYVGVWPSHPEYGMTDMECEDYDVHGGLTYASGKWGSPRQCPVEDESIHWFGFDCGHHGDVIPQFVRMNEADPNITSFTFKDEWQASSYKDIDFVMAECSRLARQLRWTEQEQWQGKGGT